MLLEIYRFAFDPATSKISTPVVSQSVVSFALFDFPSTTLTRDERCVRALFVASSSHRSTRRRRRNARHARRLDRSIA